MTSPESDAPLLASEPERRLALFREEAVRAHVAGFGRSEVLRVAPPWARGTMLVATLLVLGALVAAFTLKVEQTARARGVLRVSGGVQTIASQAAGLVVDLGAKSGDVVDHGTLLAKIDSSPTKAAIVDADAQILRAQQDVDRLVAHRDTEEAQRLTLLRQRVMLLQRRASNQRAIALRLSGKLATYDRLLDAGLTSALDRTAVENEVAQAEQSALALDEQISETRLQITSLSADIAKELGDKRQAVQKARDHRDALVFQLAQTEIRAPRGGRLEAVVVKAGDAVSVGTAIAKLVPVGAPRQIVVFLPEADRAFLREGAHVAVELDQLPAGEFGSLDAVVSRIAADLATQAEIADALGDTKLSEPTYRVELELSTRGPAQNVDALLRPGSLVTARFVLRERRLVTLFFEPLRRIFR